MNILIALLLVQAPDGWSTLKGKEAVEVFRDDRGIPHVFAKSVEDAFWAQGWLEGEDRLFQMEKYRRSAKGDSAEAFGLEALGNDIDRRRRGYTEAELQAMFDGRSERFRKVVTWFCSGINAYLKQAKFPPSFTDIKLVPRDWTPTDCVAIGVMMARRFGESGEIETKLLQAYDVFKKAKGEEAAGRMMEDLVRSPDPYAPTTLDDQAAVPKDERHDWVKPPPAMSDEWFRDYLVELDGIRAAREMLGVPNYFGSNSWTISAKKSASGHAILYGGPMMGFGTPSICNQVHLSAPGLDVGGMNFPGLPGVMIGFNGKIAWTTTTGGGDVVDVYILELNPENLEEYRYRGAWKKLESFDTVFKIAGEEPKTEKVYRSIYGPLSGKLDAKTHQAETLKMSFWLREAESFEAVVDLNFASSVAEAQKAVPKITTSHNWFVADSEGHIGFWYCGLHPIRKKGHDQRFPQKGDGSMDWEGILPFEKWPQSVDPANGFFTNWNNKPTRTWEPSGLGKIFWGKRLADVIRPKEKVSFDDMAGLARQTAYNDYLADYFMPFLLDAADPETAKKLKAYDHLKRDGEVEPAIVEKWCDLMFVKVFGDELGPLVTMKEIRKFLGSPLLYILEGEKGGEKMHYEWISPEDLAKAVKSAMEAAAKSGPWVENTIEYKTGGKIKSERGRGTFQMCVELTPEGPRAVTLSSPGQSERPDSAHYADQIGHFKTWTYYSFLWRREDMK